MSETIYTKLASDWRETLRDLPLHVDARSLKQAAFQVTWRELLALTLTVFIAHIIYNNYFHPLSRFPGPFWARTTLLWRFWHTTRGRSHRVIQQTHDKYGPVFRVSPNELSFASVESWKAIYGFPPPNSDHLIKGEFYDVFGGAYKTGCIGSERNPSLHAKKKKNLLAAFSVKALAAQEPIVQGCLDRFVAKLGPLSKASGGKGLDVVQWLEMAAFDILGEMAFGEGFGCVQNEEYHSWMELILKHLFEVTMVDNLRRVQVLASIARWLLPSITSAVRKEHSMYSRAKVQKRLDAQTPRQDFFTNIVGKVRSGDVSQEEMTAHASTLIIAGGETTATCLAAAVYYLLKTPAAMDKLTTEIREAYASYDEINATKAMQLPYLQAVINEALRIHPPGSQGFPRVSPGTEIGGFWVPKGAEVYTSAWAVTHSPQYWEDPMAFKPERWIDPESSDVKEASQPFSLGYRACIGRNFAFLEMTSCLSKIFYKYDLKLVNKDLDWEASSKCYVMWWKAPVNVLFEERDYK